MEILYPPQNYKQENPFKEQLVQLRGMPWKNSTWWKDHAPGEISDSPIELCINKVTKPSKS